MIHFWMDSRYRKDCFEMALAEALYGAAKEFQLLSFEEDSRVCARPTVRSFPIHGFDRCWTPVSALVRIWLYTEQGKLGRASSVLDGVPPRQGDLFLGERAKATCTVAPNTSISRR